MVQILDMFLLEKWPLMFKLSLGVLLEMRPLLEVHDVGIGTVGLLYVGG